mmetsp:Transcript_2171/g.3221  ORF Transcript_2171/g.3221 Transcript_2171/m.3221 type:complete len:433 (+) Transcript_2171:125-1423(+)|eukprot:CAMPEP_0194205214 /NCGR_PEP_ID=MMETSP0156-20130528/4531_1 /TAXON_ID=33649 /ORGANISM="Thalassionema nitzschioides, Strain L26-B" /LENGTH=432 /DNA_ID=CAMNT_0038931427 /DNA_START=35 /DNA_END=1333 /DNA_ORIENTATION=-
MGVKPNLITAWVFLLAASNSSAFCIQSYSHAICSYNQPLFSLPFDGNEGDDDILKSLTEKYLGEKPRMPTFKPRTSKSDLYDDDELSNLLTLHNKLYPQNKKDKETEGPRENFSSLHELVLQAIGEEDALDLDATPNAGSSTYSWLTEDISRKLPHLKAIASDVDGTLIGSDQTLHPKTKVAIQKAVQSSVSSVGNLEWFFPATGKTRWGAMNSMGPEVADLVSKCPGVFIQGLYCVHNNEVIFEKKLTKDAIIAAEKLVSSSGTSLIAYDGDTLYTTEMTSVVRELNTKWGEPLAKEIPSIAEHTPGVHKILICDLDIEKLSKVRVSLEKLASDNCATVTQAIPSMLELLPHGCSKALGVQKLCQALGVDPSTQLLALGDAENDVEMLQMAAVGVAVGNGCSLAKKAADIVLEETSDEGGAGIAIEILTNI